MMLIYRILAQVDLTPLPQPATDATTVDKVMKIVFAVSGSIAVLVITLAGLKYVMSMGENIEATKKAKDGVLNALIGLIIVIFANVIVGFVVTRL